MIKNFVMKKSFYHRSVNTEKMEIKKSSFIAGIPVKKMYVWFFPTDCPITLSFVY